MKPIGMTGKDQKKQGVCKIVFQFLRYANATLLAKAFLKSFEMYVL